jgi:hypothetical protein
LIGRSGITDERGHELLEVRFYLFHIKERALARLDLSNLKLPEEPAGLEITSIENNLKFLKMRLDDNEFTVKADLKSPPKLLGKSDLKSSSNPQKGASVWLIIIGAIAGLIIIAIIIRVFFRKQLLQKHTD